MEGYNSKMKIIFGLAFLTLAVANPTSELNNVHEYMTDEEFNNIFHTERHNVPKYHVSLIYYPKLHKRSAGSPISLRVNVFGRDIDLMLNPTDGILAGSNTPVYLASNKNGKTMIRQIRDPMARVGEMLENREKEATFIVKKKNNKKYTISGNIYSEGVGVKPLSDRLNEHCHRIRRSVNEPDYIKNATLGEYSEPVYHVIFKKREIPDNAQYVGLKMETNITETEPFRSKRSVAKLPKVVYPEFLVLADFATFQLQGENVDNFLEYILTFWNGVDLRYRLLEVPKVRLNIAGIVIATDSEVLSFFKSNKITRDKMLEKYLLSSFSKYMTQFNSHFPSISYDIAVAMTPHGICTLEDAKCEPKTLGIAYVAGACAVDQYSDVKTASVAIVTDQGTFDGINTAAHEIGHLFGSGHDGEVGSVCPAEKGHVMSPKNTVTLNSAYWSKCSLNQFANFFTNKNPSCLYDKPKTIAPMHRVLPGRLMTMDEQCQRKMGTNACAVEKIDCMTLWCFEKGNPGQCIGYGYVGLDGTICGNGKICFFGECVSEAEISNSIPV